MSVQCRPEMSLWGGQYFQSSGTVASQLPHSSLPLPQLRDQVTQPGHPDHWSVTRDTTLADSTNRVRLAILSVVSVSVSSQATLAVASLPWLAPAVYSAGNDSMASMTVWKYRKYGRPKEPSILHSGPSITQAWLPGVQVRPQGPGSQDWPCAN